MFNLQISGICGNMVRVYGYTENTKPSRYHRNAKSCVTIKNEYDVNFKTGFETNLNEVSVKNPIGFPLRLLVLKCEVKWSSFVRWPYEKRETFRTEARRDPGQQLPQSRFYSATEKEKRASGKGDERRVKRSILPTTKSADFSGWFASEASAMMFPTSQRTSSVESKRDGENQGEKDVASL
ncbi:hypothetical protein HZH66_009659 [Vespula vulgaris]|uniref:Uncharacterized protein n=1 Tax=Vespula vulgaris TaxID=7454 RepID=A0A834JMZ7_VESVU|nr:hypothetical protein HZH66_009659 [Vespula vulgaris]